LLSLLERRRRAAKFGLSFHRVRDFHVPARIKIRGREVVLALREEPGIRMAFIDIFLDDCYGSNDVVAPSTVLDIGANVGLFSVAARCALSKAQIHAYEPNPALEPSLSAQATAAQGPR